MHADLKCASHFFTHDLFFTPISLLQRWVAGENWFRPNLSAFSIIINISLSLSLVWKLHERQFVNFITTTRLSWRHLFSWSAIMLHAARSLGAYHVSSWRNEMACKLYTHSSINMQRPLDENKKESSGRYYVSSHTFIQHIQFCLQTNYAYVQFTHLRTTKEIIRKINAVNCSILYSANSLGDFILLYCCLFFATEFIFIEIFR